MAARTAVGFVETRGLVGVIEAADAAAKAADVELGAFERVGDGLVSVRFWGDVAAVQAAVLAAVEAAGKVGTVVSHHVIPAPHSQVGSCLRSHTGAPAAPAASAAPAPPPVDLGSEELENLPVARLRQLVRRNPGSGLKGREVSRANKAALIAELRRESSPRG